MAMLIQTLIENLRAYGNGKCHFVSLYDALEAAQTIEDLIAEVMRVNDIVKDEKQKNIGLKDDNRMLREKLLSLQDKQ